MRQAEEKAMKRYGAAILAVIALLAAPLGVPALVAQQHGDGHVQPTGELGQVDFPISCSPVAQEEFNRAVALLHSFWFEPARAAFTAVTQLDPTCAMGYWGIAMTWRDNPFVAPTPGPALEAGWAAVEQALAVEAPTQRERDYVAAVAAFYRDADALDHRTRALAYEQAMERVYRAYPEDREAAVFYALALNTTALPTDKTYTNQLQAAAILEEVFAEQPQHPGVSHYLIHTYDYPPIAGHGLPFANRYAGIAPAVPHALHMPSHVFTRVGYWRESIASNRASADAATNLFDRLHAMDYLTYGYLQLAQDVAARGVLEEIATLPNLAGATFVPAYALAAMPARYALERGRWSEAASLTPSPSEVAWERMPQAAAITVFARALGAARSGDAAGARESAEGLAALRAALVAANEAYWGEQVDIQRELVLAWRAHVEGRNDEALALMRAAADREDATDKHPVTPGPIVPARELLGELLLELGQPAQALEAFERSHRAEPNRFRGLYGAARAAELLGDREKARTYYTTLLELAAQADTERTELQHARAFLAS
jgi:tetratricopeptide (TPR) repeat protein